MSALFKRPKPPPPPPIPPPPDKPDVVDLDEAEARRRRGFASTVFAGFGSLGLPGKIMTPTLLGS